MSVLHPASFKEFRSLMCLWQAPKLWKKQLEVRSFNVIWRRDLWGQEVNIFRQCLKVCHEKCAMKNFRHEKAWTANQNQRNRLPRKDGTGANDCGRAAAHPRPLHPPPPTVSDTFPILAFDRLSLLLRRRCQAARQLRTYSTGQFEACYLYRSGRVTLVHLNARSSESWRGTTNFIFLFDR